MSTEEKETMQVSPSRLDRSYDPIEVARMGPACEDALAALRSFRVKDNTIEPLQQLAMAFPEKAGCATLYLGARVLYNEQLKAYMDLALEREVDEAIRRFKGTPEEDLLRHAMNAISDYSGESELKAAASYFNQQIEDFTKKRGSSFVNEVLPHFRVLEILAQTKLIQLGQLKLEIGRSSKVAKMATELQNIAIRRHASVVLRRLVARFGLYSEVMAKR